MKCELHEHISRLLFDHECVVVPEFGAFLSRYYPAEVNPATHMLRPPSRRLYFNKSIKENDGLLAKSISLTEEISYEQALAYIKKEVKQWQEGLGKGKKLKLYGIGRLYIDDSGNLQFSPSLETNYLSSSYGLAIFRSPAIHREVAIRKGIQKTIERHIPETGESAKPKKKKSIAWAAVLGPVIFAGIVGAAYYAYENERFENLSGINWFELSSEAEEPAAETPEETPEKADPVEKEAEEVSTKADETSSSEEIPVARIYPYHIVVGSFKDESNASTYIQQLQSKGYEAYLANGNQRFHRVAIGNFASLDKAHAALGNIRSNLTSEAWVYSN